MATKATAKDDVLEIEQMKRSEVTLRIIGQTGLYFNSMSRKAMGTLLIGGGKKTAAEKREIKHNPEQEFNESVYRMKDGPTLLGFPSPAIKGAMATAALETKSVTKTSVNRLLFVPDYRFAIFGKPYLRMDVVRSADMNRTPDIRTRAYLPEWCCEVRVEYSSDRFSVHSIVSMLSNAGQTVGIGDFRQEKGKGNFGTFTVHGTDMDDDAQAAWDRITAQGRAIQQEAMENPESYDDDTEELMVFLRRERMRRSA